ncbi:hypothetical protein BDE36_1788 [Arcticibacter tournemirensis]|uniref:Uncharacterized protein n=1 Tax=Arcticibacter tournemirensis TaxID=699437 RepID=A0A5M9HEM8_9SPHI|nr:hypothetical protein [Arcticibacter tournemirensis]KAA8483748.1 hypothetical protein F1649_07620 [Arcticibacter tournemirensis]TQM50053.1 hypothetical protein BDE36_1788 [Arcticibacter tournemirensis]
MTIGQLKTIIADLPDHMDVMVEQTNDECRYGMSETIEVRPVTFGGDDIPEDEEAVVDCLVISDEF